MTFLYNTIREPCLGSSPRIICFVFVLSVACLSDCLLAQLVLIAFSSLTCGVDGGSSCGIYAPLSWDCPPKAFLLFTSVSVCHFMCVRFVLLTLVILCAVFGV